MQVFQSGTYKNKSWFSFKRFKVSLEIPAPLVKKRVFKIEERNMEEDIYRWITVGRWGDWGE